MDIKDLVIIDYATGKTKPLGEPNEYIVRYEARSTDKNIVLKDRQVGISTWLLARAMQMVLAGRSGYFMVPTYELADIAFRTLATFAEHLPEEWKTAVAHADENRRTVLTKTNASIIVMSYQQYASERGRKLDFAMFSEPGGAPQDYVNRAVSSIAVNAKEGSYVCIEQSAQGSEGSVFWNIWNSAYPSGNGYTKHMLGC